MNTKKVLRGVALGAVCCSMALSITGCRGGERDPEENPVTLAIGALDGNYNPFFYTAQNDGEVTGLTQISLIGADNKANIICGQNEDTVALAYRELDANGNVIKADDTSSSVVSYEYVIKKGIKFSDGEDLTIKDVLFNFYVYLDPYYTGSSTLYATKIKGLSQYRTQRADSDDDGTGDFQGAARQRYEDLIEWDKLNSTQLETEQILKDAITVATKYKEELETAWNNAFGTAASYREVTYDSDGNPEPSYNFTEDWEVFYFTTGFAGYQYEYKDNKAVRKIVNNKYVMSFDEDGDDEYLRQDMEAELEGLSGDARNKAMKELAIDTVFSESISATYDKDGKITSAKPASKGSLAEVLQSTGAGSEALRQFLNEEMSDYYNNFRKEHNGQLAYTSIEGIKADKVTASQFTDMTAGSPLDPNKGEYDRLTITLDEVDPVAKYSFGIAVAPMHYYSGKANDGIDYVERAKETDPNNEAVTDRFGVKYADSDFFDRVLKVGDRSTDNKSGKPVGAGPYKMRDDRLEINRDCRYVRNEHFNTVGEGIENAKIKYLNYRYISDDQIVTALISGDIDYGTPQCTPKNISTIDSARHVYHNEYDSNGFGYVGINPKAVPDVTVRRAIMKAMDVADITKTYYTEEYAKVIYRPITTNSWVYSESSPYFQPVKELELTTDHKEIEAMLEDDYVKVNGVYQNKLTGQPLKFTFTIAGETQDHPAFSMFKKAERFLNECGFDITVLTDINALQKLATGSLQVWAAAWTSGIDPDMYQVYHKDSKASSVRNWGYDVIYADSTSKYQYERDLIDEMSDLIEEGRSSTSQITRTPIYGQAMNLLMELAVELPTYQRKDMYAYNSNIIDGNSLNTQANATQGPLNRIWELNYV